MDTLSLIRKPIISELNAFKELFDGSLSSANPLLDGVLAYIRRRNGKAMRPMLVLLVARLLGRPTPATLHAAVSLELLHTASLVHDDVVDDSSERRGQLAVHTAFSNKVAVLSGDYLLATSLVHAEHTQRLDIVKVISNVGKELADGELLQLANVESRNFAEEVYFEVIRKKTAVLFATCARAAAFSVGVTDEKADFVCRLGEYIGICFQIKDDIFDYSDSKEIGKPTGNDMLEGKLTLPVLYALRKAEDDEAMKLALRVRDRVATAEEIARLVAFTKEQGGIEYAIASMEAYKRQALDMLATLPPTPVREALCAYVEYVSDRAR